MQFFSKEMDEQEVKIKNMYDSNELVSTNSSEKNTTGYQTPIDWKKGVETLSISSTDSSSMTDKSTVLYQPNGKKTESLKTVQNGQNSKNVEEKNPSNTNNMETVTENYSTSTNFTRKSSSSPHCDIHSNAKDTLSIHKKLLDETHSPEFSSFHDPTRKLMKPVSDQKLSSVSLINLWSSQKKEADTNSDKCIQRLQEEKLRRTVSAF